MQFKYPELLWGLFLLLIPIFIHLFQLRKFKKTPFTNVKLLQKVVAKSRRSNTLKKWLLLFTRMLLLTALIIAFAQPFFAEKSALQEKETVIYLDDSFSMQARVENTTLLDDAVQNLIKELPKDKLFSLFTNTKVFKGVRLKDIQNDLLALDFTEKQLKLNEIYLKANSLFTSDKNTVKNTVVISDFQQRMASTIADSINTIQKHLIRMDSQNSENVSIDSVFVNNTDSGNIELTALLSSNFTIESIPVSLFSSEKLIAKTSAPFNENKKAKVNFTLPRNEVIKGKIEIADSGLTYDNQLFLNIDTKDKIKILSIDAVNSRYLKRIFTQDEFLFTSFNLKNLNYARINNQNIIVLNELENIPPALSTNLKSFTDNGGSLVVVPAVNIDIDSYNQLVSNYSSTTYTQGFNKEQQITDISFSHPLFRNVFEKKVVNFQYPKVSHYYSAKTNARSILSFQDKSPFLFGSDQVFIFTASISSENSNFKNSPLIVPTFFNMGVNSLKSPELYTLLGSMAKIEIPIKLAKDHILKVTKDNYEFIPQQQSFAKKTTLTFYENPTTDGIYAVKDDKTLLKNVSFNYPRAESQLNYMNMEDLNANTSEESIASLFQNLRNDNAVNEFWKWFVILAVLFMIVEILIQKFIK